MILGYGRFFLIAAFLGILGIVFYLHNTSLVEIAAKPKKLYVLAVIVWACFVKGTTGMVLGKRIQESKTYSSETNMLFVWIQLGLFLVPILVYLFVFGTKNLMSG